MEAFLIRYSIYVVFAIILVVWIGIALWLWRLEKRIAKLEGGQDHASAIVHRKAES